MKLTTRGRFAVNAMLDLAMNTGNNVPVRLEDISERQNISKPYLEQLFNKLRRNGLVKSLRGPGGGYVLARKANEINIAEIVHAVEDSMDASVCRGQGNCLKGKPCLLAWGMQDFCFTPEFLSVWQQYFPKAESYQFSNAGHYVIEDAKEEILPLIRQFIAGHSEL